MTYYELELNKLTPHPNGTVTAQRVGFFNFQGEHELLYRINAAAQNEVIKWHQEQKEKNG